MGRAVWRQPLSWHDDRSARSARNGQMRAAAKTLLAADPAASEWRGTQEIDPRVVAAVLLAEDRRFWHHHGIDLTAVCAATIRNLRYRRMVFGASTISMQVARMLRAWSKPTYARKVRESLLALWLVARHDREAVLEVYLNLVRVVSGTRGVAAGGVQLIGSDPCHRLSVFDTTLLAATVSVCPDLSPRSMARSATWLRDKQMRLVEDLVESGHVTPREAAQASLQIATCWASSGGVGEEGNDSRAGPVTRARFLGSSADRARRRALGWALAQVGTTDNPTADGFPRGHGRVESWRDEFGISGLGWCGAFVGYALRVVAGIQDIDVRVVWVPHVLQDAAIGRLGWKSVIHPREAVPGDVVLLNFDGSGKPEHIGFVVANDQAQSIMYTVEGNTSPDGSGDQSHGGGVFARERSYYAIVACARPRYSAARLTGGVEVPREVLVAVPSGQRAGGNHVSSA